MTAVTLGEGPRAVRVIFGDEYVQLRTYGSVIDGNADMATALKLVLDLQPHEAQARDVDEDNLDAICRILRDLGPYGVPVYLWGPQWEQRCMIGGRA